jgi:branched-chain amino acid transport system substrate-binding protein
VSRESRIRIKQGRSPMTKARFATTRRTVLGGAAAGAVLLGAPALLRAQQGPVVMAALNPLTGAGGNYGPGMLATIQAAAQAANDAGGIDGREIELVSEDTQTSPEAAVRAARKIIDVDQAIAIMGTWASSVTTAVAPLCWESRTMLSAVSGADSITRLPHDGYFFRTQPTTTLQIDAATRFMLDQGAEKIAYIGPQTPFTQDSIDMMGEIALGAGKSFDSLIYEADKASYGSEADQILHGEPDFLFLGGYTPDVTVLLKDLFRAGYEQRMLAFAYAVNQALVESLPQDVTNGIYVFSPTPAVDSQAYQRVQEILGADVKVDPYSAQTYDQANLMILAAAAGEPTGTGIRDALRTVSQGDGETVDNVADGLGLLAEGKSIQYSGASGPCDFDNRGDIREVPFLFEQVQDGSFEVVERR